MDFPQIQNCLVAEGFRQEILGKYTILGFFGIAPNVHIAIADFKNAVTLCFFFVGGPGSGAFRANIRFVSPSGESFAALSDAEGEFTPEKSVSYVIIGFQAVLPGPGKYALTLTVNEQDKYSTTVEFHQGDKAEMARSTKSKSFGAPPIQPTNH